jgi:hypothetical protein
MLSPPNRLRVSPSSMAIDPTAATNVTIRQVEVTTTDSRQAKGGPAPTIVV